MRIARLRAVSAAALLLIPMASPALALDLGDGLRGTTQSPESADWQTLASLEIEPELSAEEALDMMAREEKGEPLEGAPIRSSERVVSDAEAEAPLRAVRSADPASVSRNLMGPARAPTYVPSLPSPTSSVAVLPSSSWTPSVGRSSVSVLATY